MQKSLFNGQVVELSRITICIARICILNIWALVHQKAFNLGTLLELPSLPIWCGHLGHLGHLGHVYRLKHLYPHFPGSKIEITVYVTVSSVADMYRLFVIHSWFSSLYVIIVIISVDIFSINKVPRHCIF